MIWKGMRKHALGDTANQHRKEVSGLQQVATLCIDDHLIPPEDCETTGLSAENAQIVLMSLYKARIGRLDLLWSVNTFARSVTKMNNTCDERLLILINYLNHTKN